MARLIIIIIIIMTILAGLAMPASARIPAPIEHGDWQLRCVQPQDCTIERRRWPGRNALDDIVVMIASDPNRRGYLKVSSLSWNRDTCLRVELSEEVPVSLQSNHGAGRFHRAAGALNDRILAVLRSHFAMLAICDPMGRFVSPAPRAQLEASAGDLDRALQERGWLAMLEATRP
ncbi:MAG TPA: hypothetical protein VMG08_14360 [Allosphingosinicella sp.]|nr:hypothetical protein [Allosphingosinicella sp.]